MDKIREERLKKFNEYNKRGIKAGKIAAFLLLVGFVLQLLGLKEKWLWFILIIAIGGFIQEMFKQNIERIRDLENEIDNIKRKLEKYEKIF